MENQAPHFNLIDEPWIPVRYPDGRSAELGIRETLLTADRIAEIQDASPLVVAALHRFLLAVLYRALEGPTDRHQAKTWFKQGWPKERIEEYLSRWHDRFWLRHPRFPFGQIPTFEPKTWRAWTVLAAEHNADNAKVLFDHVDVNAAGAISPAQAARWLLATQTFSVSCGKSELSHTGTAPSATAVMALPLGHTLADTLLFLLVPQNRAVLAGDVPLWEREPESVEALKGRCERAPGGYADRYTWRTRSVRLRVAESPGISTLAFASGMGVAENLQTDPMLSYDVDKQDGRVSVSFRGRGFWRDFDSLLPDATGRAPLVVEHAVDLAGSTLARFPATVLVVGQANEPGKMAKIAYWRMERYALPRAMSGDHFIRAEIHTLLAKAEEAQTSLWLACKSYARDLLSRGEREPAGKDISNFIRQMPVNDSYWSSLEARFQQVLREYTEEREFEDVRHLWLTFVRDALSAAWESHRAGVATGDAWSIRALAKAEGPVRRRLGLLKEEISKLDPQKEPA